VESKNYLIYKAFQILEVGPWCNGKCLSPKATSCKLKFENQPLQTKFGVRLPTMTFPRTHKSGSFVH